MSMINVRTWLICLWQNARLTAGAVKTLKVAPGVRSMGAVKATRIMPRMKPASVSNHRQIRYSFFVAMLICCWFLYASDSLSLLVTAQSRRSSNPATTFNGDLGLYFFVWNMGTRLGNRNVNISALFWATLRLRVDILQNNKPSSVSFDPSQHQLFGNSSCDPQFQKLK